MKNATLNYSWIIKVALILLFILATSSSFIGYTQSVEPEWSATGFALKNGYVVTNYHVTKDAKTIMVRVIQEWGYSKDYEAVVVAKDWINDLAIVKIIDPGFSGFGAIPYSIKTQTTDVGEKVWTLGYPLTQILGNEIKLTDGIISAKSGYMGDASTYQISVPVQPGNSGGPLFDSKGNVVGIVNAGVPGAENVGYAIKSSFLKELVNSNNLSEVWPNHNTISSLSLSEKVKRVNSFVFMLLCSSKATSSHSSSTTTSISTTKATYLTLSESQIYVDKNEGFASVGVNTDANDYSIISTPSWCTIHKRKEYISISFSANTNPWPRSATIVIYAGDIRKSLTITQQANSASFLTISPDHIDVKKTAGSVWFEVYTDATDYSISRIPEWCSIKNKYKTWFTLSFEENSSRFSRSGDITITVDGKEMTATISQEANPATYLTVSPNPIRLHRGNGVIIVDLKTDSKEDYSIEGLPDWCEIKSKYDTWFSLSYKANYGLSSRKATITISVGGMTQLISIIQP